MSKAARMRGSMQLSLWAFLVAAAWATPHNGEVESASHSSIFYGSRPAGSQPTTRRLQSDSPETPSPGSTSTDLLSWLSRVEVAITSKMRHFSEAYQTSESRLADVKFYDTSTKERDIVKRLLRAMVLGDSFVVVVGGMSDTAGHGNLFNDSYPLVLRDTIRDVMALANIKFDVRNMAMGGVPSYPSSMCMKDVWGIDSDVIMWDFRMVEHDAIKGELYVRQALLHPRRPFVAFKRQNGYLNTFKKYYEQASLHAIDERQLVKFVNSNPNASAVALLTPDNFCSTATCECPGQVRWHSGYKMNRLRGVHMAMVYLKFLKEAVIAYRTLLGTANSPEDIRGMDDWKITPRLPSDIAEPYAKQCLDRFCSETYNCATTWAPRLADGAHLPDKLDSDSQTKWKLVYQNNRAKSATEKGHSLCGYKDAKQQLSGGQPDAWIFFKFESENSDGTVAFCADFPSDIEWKEMTLVLLNGEEIQGEMESWLGAKTLGVNTACYSHTGGLTKGSNVIGFRCMQDAMTLAITHLLWQ